MSFLGMWIVMMALMMAPSLIPMLRRYRRHVRGAGTARLAWLTALVAMGYFTLWTMIGVIVYPLGVVLSAAAVRLPMVARVTPVGAAAVVLAAGILQFTAWKARRIVCCRETHGDPRSLARAGMAWRHGWRLGRRCASCCAGLMAASIVVGIMDWRVMAITAVAIAAERVSFTRLSLARVIGVATVGVGLVLLVQGIREHPTPSKAGHRRWGDGVADSVRCRALSYNRVGVSASPLTK